MALLRLIRLAKTDVPETEGVHKTTIMYGFSRCDYLISFERRSSDIECLVNDSSVVFM